MLCSTLTFELRLASQSNLTTNLTFYDFFPLLHQYSEISWPNETFGPPVLIDIDKVSFVAEGFDIP